MLTTDQRVRCPWGVTDSLYITYHDEEWGVPIRHDDNALFERICLEGAQAGLSWYTVLKKREQYRVAFDGFDPEKIARYDDAKVAELLANPGIIRNRAKVASAIHNAQRFLDLKAELGSFSDFLWRFAGYRTQINHLRTLADYPAVTPESTAMSKALVKRGFKLCGPTMCYAMMQAVGMVNDHTVDCYRHAECAALAVTA